MFYGFRWFYPTIFFGTFLALFIFYGSAYFPFLVTSSPWLCAYGSSHSGGFLCVSVLSLCSYAAPFAGFPPVLYFLS
jgi:hypothetical protein